MNRPSKPKLHCKTEKQISDYLLRLESYTTQLEAKYKEAVERIKEAESLLNRAYIEMFDNHIELLISEGDENPKGNTEKYLKDITDFLKGVEDEI